MSLGIGPISRAVAVILAVAASAVAAAAEVPEAVSPGAAARLARVGAACPTFSWTAASGAKRYELVVYAVGETERESKKVLSKVLPGGATSWTPSLDSCLEGGRKYAWSLRALGGRATSEWSAPSLFEVALGPSEAALEAALEAVKDLIADEGEGVKSVSAARESTAVAEPGGPTRSGAPGPRAAPAPTQLSVDGNIEATSFTGDGSNLTGLGNPDGPCFNSTHRFVDCANGTVTDTVTGLIYLKNANCFGTQDWVTANQSAAALADGSCGLTDGSRPGDWRLQTKEEWEGISDASCSAEPKVLGNQSPAPGCYTDAGDPDSEWATSVVSNYYYWSSSTQATNTTRAWLAFLAGGSVGLGDKPFSGHVWPVREGQ